ncbi:hypothetical protein PR048_032021, partial [Dryococelus australis]
MKNEAYSGLFLCAGVYRANREELSELWNEENGRPIFRLAMPFKRSKEITRFIRFFIIKHVLNASVKINLRLSKLLPSYVHGYGMTVDKQLVGLRGKYPFCQYMKSKPGRYSIKIRWVCDSETSFLLNGHIYLSKPTHGTRDKNQGSRVINEL